MKILKLTILISLSILTLGLTSCGKLETKTHEISEDFTNISIVNDTASVIFVPTDGECKVVCEEKKNVNHKVEVVDGTLKIEVIDSRKFYQKMFSFSNDSVTVYLPKSQLGAISVKTDTGKVEIDGIGCNSFSLEVDTGVVSLKNVSSVGAFDVKSDTGKVTLENCQASWVSVTCDTGDISLKNLSSASSLEVKSDTGKVALENCRASTISIVSDTGDIKMSDVFCINMSSKVDTGKTTMNNVIASGKLEISANTGDVNFEGCDGSEVYITTDTGDVKGSFLTAKIVFAETDTGKVDVPKLLEGGRCEITTDTGDIKISINQ